MAARNTVGNKKQFMTRRHENHGFAPADHAAAPWGWILFWSLVLSLMVLAGCAGTQGSSPSRPGPGASKPGAGAPTGKPYTVLGQTYYPLTSAQGYAEEGIASWYGPQFHAKRTASGEVYNMYDLTAAHRVLPMQTRIRVTNVKNGKSVVLRVNDRGPFVDNRIVDLSYAAARELDVIGPGTAQVRLEALGRWPGGIPGKFFIQIGSFSKRENAAKMQARMHDQGHSGTRIVQAEINGQTFWRVQVGTYQSLDAAQSARQSMARQEPGAFVIAD